MAGMFPGRLYLAADEVKCHAPKPIVSVDLIIVALMYGQRLTIWLCGESEETEGGSAVLR